MPAVKTLQTLPYPCPPWCIVDHATIAADEEQVDWREHASSPAAFLTRLGDLVAVDVRAGDDLQTGMTGCNEVHVRLAEELMSPDEAQRLAAYLIAAAALSDERSSAGGAV